MPAARPIARVAAAVAAAALVLIAACTQTTAPTAQRPALSAAQAQAVGDAMSAEAQGELEGLTFSGGLFAPGFAMTAPFTDGTTTTCMPTRSPTPVVDSDSDRVPDSVRVTFPGCAFGEGGETDTIRGTIDIVDPTPDGRDRAIRIVFTDFTRIEVEEGGERSIVLNGARQASRDSNAISLSETNFTTVFASSRGDTATTVRNGTATFTADVPGSIQPDQPLPSGTLDLNGSSSWTRDTSSFALTVATSPPLHYNASCAVRPKFDGGTLQLTVTRDTTTTNVTVQFTACGQYTVTRS